jgi:hypothetical protein
MDGAPDLLPHLGGLYSKGGRMTVQGRHWWLGCVKWWRPSEVGRRGAGMSRGSSGDGVGVGTWPNQGALARERDALLTYLVRRGSILEVARVSVV